MALTAEELTDLLENFDITIDVGCHLLDEHDVFLEDISAWIDPNTSSVGGVVDRKIGVTATLGISKTLDWSKHRVQPFMRISAPSGFDMRFGLPLSDEDGSDLTDDEDVVLLDDSPAGLIRAVRSNEWPLGVHVMATPERQLAEDPPLFRVECYDKTQVLDTAHGQSVRVPAGGSYLDAAITLIQGAGETRLAVDMSAFDKTAVNDRDWLIGDDKTTLEIVNDCLQAINYRKLWCDRNGYFRLVPFVKPQVAAPVWLYSADSTTTPVEPERSETIDVFDTPNTWNFYRDDPGQDIPAEGNGLYFVQNRDIGPSSIDGRGGRKVRSIHRLDSADQESFIGAADEIVAKERRPARTVQVKVVPNPQHWIGDVVMYVDGAIPPDPDLAKSERFAVSEWTLPFDGSGMELVLDEVSEELPPFQPGGGSFTGGTMVDVGIWRTHTFDTTGPHTLTMVAPGTVYAEYVAAGAGGPGRSVLSNEFAGGSGAGAVRRAIFDLSGDVLMTVGAGGAAGSIGEHGDPGGDTIFGSLSTAKGGASGGTASTDAPDGQDGGSGGGGKGGTTGADGGRGSFGGHDGGAGFEAASGVRGGGGGGGAGDVGEDGTATVQANGGPGVPSACPGVSATYGKGGDGGFTAITPVAGVNPGDGGDGPSGSVNGAAGADGIIHVWYLIPTV